MVEWLALLVSILALLSVRDLGVAWWRIKVIGVAACVLAVVLVVGLLVETFVLPLTGRYFYIPDGMLWPFVGGLFVLAAVLALWDFIRGRRRRTKGPERGRDPGDYKMGW